MKPLLLAWLIADVVWGLTILGGCSYAVFWLNHSGLWFLLTLILLPGLGGDKLYKALYADITGKEWTQE